MSLVRLIIKGISYSQTQNGAYALILSELEGQRKLPIVIGAFEAQSIAIALEKEIKPPRPPVSYTHLTLPTNREVKTPVRARLLKKRLDSSS